MKARPYEVASNGEDAYWVVHAGYLTPKPLRMEDVVNLLNNQHEKIEELEKEYRELLARQSDE